MRAGGDLSPEALHAVAETLPIVVFRTDANGSNTYVNRAWEDLTGQTRALARGAGWTEPIHPDDLSAISDRWVAAIACMEPFEAEMRLRDRDGTYRWYLTRSRPVCDANGRLEGWFGTSTEIDAQKRAAQALSAAKTRAEFLADAEAILERSFARPHVVGELARVAVGAFATICFFDENRGDDRLLRVAAAHRDPDWHERFARLLPYEPRRAPRIDDALRTGTAHYATGLGARYYREIAVDAGHERFLAELGFHSIVVVAVRTRDQLFGAFTFARCGAAPPFDEEDRITAEELARRVAATLDNGRLFALALDNERRANAIADTLPILFWTARPDGAIDWFNRGWYEYTGRTAEETLGAGWLGVPHPHDVPELLRRWRASLAGGAPFEMSHRLRGADGIYRWFLTRMVPQHDDRGTVVRWYGSNTDIDSQRRATLQLALFAELGERLGHVATVEATLDAVLDALVPRFADTAIVELCEENELSVAAVEHRDPGARATLAALVGRKGTATAFEFARDALDAGREALAFAGKGPADMTFTSALAAPLVVDATVHGVLTLAILDDAEAFAGADLPFVGEIARRIGPALAKAHVYDRERRIAETFQNAALPRRLPAIAGLRFDALYEPGRAEALVGGDWFDAFRLADGRVVLTIGDVLGSGLTAAAAMAEVRQSIRGAAAINPDPAILLDAADRVFAASGDERYATAWVGLLDPIDFSLRFASAGHPPPLLRTAAGAIERLTGDGLPLGLAESLALRRSTRTCFVEPGSVLLLYTDGLIESERDAIRGEADLAAALAATPVPRARVLRDAMLGGDAAHDDVALLVVGIDRRLPDADDAATRWSFDVTSAVAAGHARRALAASLRAARFVEDAIVVAEIIVAELLGNAVRYAGGHVEVILDRTTGVPVLHVLDEGAGFTHNPRLPADAYAESGRGLYIVNELAREFTISRAPSGGSHARVVLETRPAVLAAERADTARS